MRERQSRKTGGRPTPLPLDRLNGSIPPLLTPFKNGEVDYDVYVRLVQMQIDEGSHGILVNGTTSEPATLTTEERNRLVSLMVEIVKGRVPVVAATGYRPNLSSLVDAPGGLTDDGYPCGRSPLPGLHFVGFHESVRGQLFEANREGRMVAAEISRAFRAGRRAPRARGGGRRGPARGRASGRSS